MKRLFYISVFMFVIQLSGQTGPAGVGSTDGSSALEIWLHAEKGLFSDAAGSTAAGSANSTRQRIGRWSDQSGNGFHARRNTATHQPGLILLNSIMNSRPVVEFNRNFSVTDNFNRLTITGNPLVDSMTVIVAFYPRLSGGGSDNDASGGLSSDQYYYGAGLFCTEQPGIQNEYSVCWNSNSMGLGIGNSATASDVTIKLPSSLNSPHIGLASWSRLGVSRIVHDAGTPKINNTVSVVPRSATQIMIGALNTAAFDVNHFDGYIAQVIAYSRLLNQAEEIILHNYLSSSYSIPLLNNDVYSMDETSNGDFDFEMAGIGMASDGSSQVSAQGESRFRIFTPDNLNTNEYLFWAHNNASGTSNDVPTGFHSRSAQTWIFQEIGETGNVHLTADITGLNLDTLRVYLALDLNNNGVFADETKNAGLIKGTYLGNGLVDFGILNPQSIQFTLLEEHQCALAANNAILFNGSCSEPLQVTITESALANATAPIQYQVTNEVTGEVVNYADPSFKIGEGIFTIALQDAYACTLELASKKIVSFCGLSFSPNGDGVRDEFFIEKSGTAKIFDKNGKTIQQLETPAYWNGSTNHGQPAPGGYYLILINDEKQYVTLIR
jgi:hypothetical protein